MPGWPREATPGKARHHTTQLAAHRRGGVAVRAVAAGLVGRFRATMGGVWRRHGSRAGTGGACEEGSVTSAPRSLARAAVHDGGAIEISTSSSTKLRGRRRSCLGLRSSGESCAASLAASACRPHRPPPTAPQYPAPRTCWRRSLGSTSARAPRAGAAWAASRQAALLKQFVVKLQAAQPESWLEPARHVITRLRSRGLLRAELDASVQEWLGVDWERRAEAAAAPPAVGARARDAGAASGRTAPRARREWRGR